MRSVEIDDEVFAHLQNHAIAYIETNPNATLRRLLGLNDINQPTSSVPNTGSTNGNSARSGRKSPKASLQDLTSAGLLQEGQSLYLVDYQKTRVPDYEAKIAGKGLSWNGELHSMSELAKILLKKRGFHSDAVRGPTHWSNADGITVMVLWDEYLKGWRMRQTT